MGKLHLIELDFKQVVASFRPEKLDHKYQSLIRLQNLPGAHKMLDAPTQAERESGKVEYLRAFLDADSGE
jgi:hypothetical protein